MIIDLDQLKTRHPVLPVEVAATLGFLAALALQRRHQPGVSLSAEVHGAATTHAITWRLCPEEGARAGRLGTARPRTEPKRSRLGSRMRAASGW